MERGAVEGIPAGRLGTPEEYGDLVAFICSERAGYLTGTVIPLRRTRDDTRSSRESSW